MVDVYTVKVEEARSATHEKPSAGPVYRCIYAKDALLDLPSHFQSPWDFFSDNMADVNADGTPGSGEDLNMLDGHKPYPAVVLSGFGGRKRSRKATGDAIVDEIICDFEE